MDQPPDDFDDLINDYIEDGDFGPPPEVEDYDMNDMIDEDHEMAMSVQKADKASVHTLESSTVTGPGSTRNEDVAMATLTNESNEATTETGKEAENNLQQTTSEKSSEDDECIDDVQVRDYLSEKQRLRPGDMYSFERYSGNSDWRNTGSSKQQPMSPTMKAQRWKEQISSGSNGSLLSSFTLPSINKFRQASNSPDTQLLESMKRRQGAAMTQSPTTVSMRYSRGITSTHPLGCSAVPVTAGDGSRFYVRTRSEYSGPSKSSSTSSATMLGVSMKTLLRRTEQALRRLELAKRLSHNSESNESEQLSSSESSKENGKFDVVEDSLYVDKHAPNNISQLLSDERTNREVLRALREWDPYVFGKDPPPRPSSHVSDKDNYQAMKAGAAKPQQPSHDKRPEETRRVILLSGPPGVGKSSLAHIVARHAGYRPLEVNASDERSANVLTERVYRAMESTTLNIGTVSKEGSSKRKTGNNNASDFGKPNCLILDEVDGADAKGAVAALVELIRAEIPPKGGKNADPSSKKLRMKRYLRRPIIFICNHKYSPVLRPLLPYCRQFNVYPPSASRLVSRLQSVMRSEGLFMSGGNSVLNQLVTTSGGDIRNCLHTVQFAATAGNLCRQSGSDNDDEQNGSTKKDITQALKNSLGTGAGGLKDSRNDLAGTVTTVFRKTKSKKHAGGTIGSQTASSRVFSAVEGFGDNGKTIDSLFLNVLRVSYIDPTMDRCAASHELLSEADLYRSSRLLLDTPMEQYSMQRLHMPTSAAAIHVLCSVELRSDLQFSTRELSDSRYQQESNQSLLHKFADGLPATSKGTRSTPLLSMETIPYSLWILSAGGGNSSLQRSASSVDILNKREREVFDNYVLKMRSLGLTYVVASDQLGDSSNPKGQNNYVINKEMRLEPPIERLVQYLDAKVTIRLQRREIPTVMKELIAHRVRIDNMNQPKEAVESSPEHKPSTVNPDSIPQKEVTAKVDDSKATIASPSNSRKPENSETKLPPAKRAKTSSPPSLSTSNFLGIGARNAKAAKSARRAALVGLERSKKTKLAHSGSGLLLSQVIRLKYTKGFTQAVRTPCRIQDLE